MSGETFNDDQVLAAVTAHLRPKMEAGKHLIDKIYADPMIRRYVIAARHPITKQNVDDLLASFDATLKYIPYVVKIMTISNSISPDYVLVEMYAAEAQQSRL